MGLNEIETQGHVRGVLYLKHNFEQTSFGFDQPLSGILNMFIQV